MVLGDGATTLWPQMMGMLRAKELMMLAERILPEQAVAFSLANWVVPYEKLMDEATDGG